MFKGKNICDLATLALTLCIPLSSSFAFTIDPNAVHYFSFAQKTDITGASASGDHFFVVNGKDASIFEFTLDRDRPGQKIVPTLFKPLTSQNNYSNYASQYRRTDLFDLEGMTSYADQNTGIVFFLVNERTGDLLQSDRNGLKRINVIYKENFPDYKYEVGHDGFIGVAVDSFQKNLFVAKQKNPNMVYLINLKQNNRVTKGIDLSTGSNLYDDISDLAFLDGYLYVLRKNTCRIERINPYLPTLKEILGSMKAYDYSEMEDVAKNGEQGLAEGLVIQKTDEGKIKASLFFKHSATQDPRKNVMAEFVLP